MIYRVGAGSASVSRRGLGEAQGQRTHEPCLAVRDRYTGECLAIDVAGFLRSRWVLDALSRLVKRTWRAAVHARQ